MSLMEKNETNYHSSEENVNNVNYSVKILSLILN